jgi:group I intron endonuclease
MVTYSGYYTYPRKGNMKNIVYLTLNKLKPLEVYIGVHCTVDADKDDYLGSGLRIKNSIKKYGKDNFVKIVLETFETKDQAYLKEDYWIELYRSFGFTLLNLNKGGKGGFDYINNNQLQKTEKFKNIQSNIGKSLWENKKDLMSPDNWKNYSYKEHSKKMSENNPASKSIKVLYPSGEIKLFKSLVECAKYLNIGLTALRSFLKGNISQKSKWYNYEFVVADKE